MNSTEPLISETLAGQPAGTRVKVTGYSLPPASMQRLLEMGLTIGTECAVVRYAPLGDPVEIRLRSYHLSIRTAEARGIHVERLH